MKDRIGVIIKNIGYMMAAGFILAAALLPAKPVYAAETIDITWTMNVGEIKKNTSTGEKVTLDQESSTVNVDLYTTSGNTIIGSSVVKMSSNPPGNITGTFEHMPKNDNAEVKYYAKVKEIRVNGQNITLSGENKSNEIKADGSETSVSLAGMTDIIYYDAVNATKLEPAIIKSKSFAAGTAESDIEEFFDNSYESVTVKDASGTPYSATIEWDYSVFDEYDPDSGKSFSCVLEGDVVPDPEWSFVNVDAISPVKVSVTIAGSSGGVINKSQCKVNSNNGCYKDTKSLGVKLKSIDTGDIAKILNRQIKLNNAVAEKILKYNDPDNYALSVLMIVSESDGDHSDAILDKAKDDSGHSDTTLDVKFDISLYLYVLDKNANIGSTENQWYIIGQDDDDLKITDLGDASLKVKYTIPDKYKTSSSSSSSSSASGKSRYFNVFTYHEADDKARKAGGDWEKDTSSIEFSVSKLSEFALAHYDVSSSSSSSTGSSSSSTGSGTGAGGGGDAGSGGGAPKTGDTSEIIRWTYFFVIGITVFLCALILLQDARGYEDRDNE